MRLLPILCLAILCLATTGNLFSATFDVKETPEWIVISTPTYVLSVDRTGFGLRLENSAHATILESPRQSSILKLHEWHKEGAGVMLDYDEPHGGTGTGLEEGATQRNGSVLVEVQPEAAAIGFTLRRLDAGTRPAPSMQVRLASSGSWYGGGFQGFREPQRFPLNDAVIKPRWFLADGNSQGTPAWLATSGVAVWVRTPHDFLYSINPNQNGLLSVEMPAASALRWDILVNRNIREVARQIVHTIGLPKTVPPDDYFRLPIYTTWVEHKTHVSQQRVLEYGDTIRKNNLPCGVIEIDDRWEVHYGDMEFDKTKFPDPRKMTDEMHRKGFRVTLWVHPFVNVESAAFHDPAVRGFLLKDRDGQVGLIRWWQGVAGVWDFTNPRAAAAFRARLERMQKIYGLDGFKFDGGDANLLPPDFAAHENITTVQYCDIYNREAAAHFQWEETRVGALSQSTGVVQRLIDKQSVWGLENGLAALVPEAITVSVRGFAYLMPDMIGGNEYDNDHIEPELLMRWAEASALMPLMQFSKGPWHFGEEAVRVSRDMSSLHQRFAPYLIQLAKQFPVTGDPILRPLWYNSPEDAETFRITDQFMIGSDVVVAPVLKKGATDRKLYLPAGHWKEWKSGKMQEGKTWIEVPAPLDTLPLFVREGSSAASL